TVGVPKETYPGENRVAMSPAALPSLIKKNVKVLIEPGAGEKAGFVDAAYTEKGAKIAASRKEVFAADVVLQVRTYGANPEEGKADLELMRPDLLIAGLSEPLVHPQAIAEIAERKATLFAMELIPRITRAQSMDVLSSQANIGGYKAVLLAAEALTKMFPMMTTAAGTIPPARVFILGAGVAGLQAIATAKRLGAVVEAFDVRPEVKEQVMSLGGKFVEVELDTAEASGTGGYAKEQSEEFLKKQREVLAKTIAASDVVITTAQVPGKKAPVLVTEEMVKGMSPGSVIVDMAAGQGGNVEPSRPNEVVELNGVKIIGPTNLPATVASDASAMYAKNCATLLLHLLKDGGLNLNMEDEIIRETLVAKDGEVTNARVREALGMPPAAAPEPAKPPAEAETGEPEPAQTTN
ncbi:MAG: Re/Si-specific NAD(P)(+) transhydrogenase subunit alpha, partial [Actinomycetota bacterium]